jgi:outer membrane immunogenic protein
MKKLLITGVALAALIGTPALAADMAQPVYKAPPPLPPPCIWCGWYVGVNAGYNWSGSNEVSTTSTPVLVPGGGINVAFSNALNSLGTFNSGTRQQGFIGGGQVGYNWQLNSIVAGIETDIQGIANSGQTRISNGTIALGFGSGQSVVSTATVSQSLDYLGTLRGRAGVLITPAVLAYATGGLAYGGVRASTNLTQSLVPNSLDVGVWNSVGNLSEVRLGWTAGAGVEWKLWSNWSAKAEYLYYDLGSSSYNGTPIVTTNGGTPFSTNAIRSTARFNGNVVRVGLNYNFSSR